MRWMGAFVAAAVMALVGCGSSDDFEKAALAAVRAELAKAGYLPAYQRCAVGEIERLMSGDELRALGEGSQAQKLKSSKVLESAGVKCREETGPRIIDPHATSEQLAPLKVRFAEGLAAEVAKEGVAPAQARCFERHVQTLPDPEFVELANSTPADAVKQLVPAGRACFAG